MAVKTCFSALWIALSVVSWSFVTLSAMTQQAMNMGRHVYVRSTALFRRRHSSKHTNATTRSLDVMPRCVVRIKTSSRTCRGMG